MSPLTGLFRRSAEPYRGEFEEPFEGEEKPAEAASQPLWEPLVDVVEEPEAYRIVAAVPGVAKESIHVSVERDTVKVSGERKSSEGRLIARELPFGRFERGFRFPHDLDAAKIQALCRDGLLELRVPKPAAGGREITVQ